MNIINFGWIRVPPCFGNLQLVTLIDLLFWQAAAALCLTLIRSLTRMVLSGGRDRKCLFCNVMIAFGRLWHTKTYGGFHYWGYPNSWRLYKGKSIYKWMMTGGTPIYGTPHIESKIATAAHFFLTQSALLCKSQGSCCGISTVVKQIETYMDTRPLDSVFQ